MRKHFTTLQGFNLKEGALKEYSGQGAVRAASCPAQGLKRKARTTPAGRRRTCSGKPDRRAERGMRPNVLPGTLPFTVLKAGALRGTLPFSYTFRILSYIFRIFN
ncbi:MAG: hypothetical protein LBH90_03145 [Tannerella sp.]|nr:hypothetical protein [Tannerella sp.]